MFHPADHPHRRYNPLADQWILVSPHRAKRPWQGQQEAADTAAKPVHDPSCYLCPGNKRITGEQNPDYTEPFVFTNDFSALLPDTPAYSDSSHPLFQSQSVRGVSRVICFSPDHGKTLPELPPEQIEAVIRVWQHQTCPPKPMPPKAAISPKTAAPCCKTTPKKKPPAANASWPKTTTGWPSSPTGPHGRLKPCCCPKATSAASPT